MAAQLDILALEPFYGGPRRAMLETLFRGSRHRWTLLKLPPRRMERRLSAAAHWFAEQLSRHWIGRVDLLFTSEALNLADFYRLMPSLASKPSVVYFHDDQLPLPGQGRDEKNEIVNLSTGAAATELWFNSEYHFHSFLNKATAIVERHPELAGHNPVTTLRKKSRLMFPPADLNLAQVLQEQHPVPREARNLFVDTRDSDCALLNTAFERLLQRGENFQLVTVGPVESLAPGLVRSAIPEADETAVVRAMLQCGVIVSAKAEANADYRLVMAIAAGCWPVVPNSAVYPEIIPDTLHEFCLHDLTPQEVAFRIDDFWHLEMTAAQRKSLMDSAQRFNAITCCRAMDDRLTELAASGIAKP
ncbi:MAG TPA: DUF3524 domain-containing protein [Tepidisphaeraceae bacterium]|nr:DUF3524 domain-containing protein [Tepidisphaeraceae bacterium]